MVNEPKEQKYGISDIRDSALLLSKASINVSDNIEGLTPRLARVVNIIQKIKNGEYVDLKEEKMAKIFNTGNPILIQNRLNCLDSDDDFRFYINTPDGIKNIDGTTNITDNLWQI